VSKQKWQSNAKIIAESAEAKLADQLNGLAYEWEVVQHPNRAVDLSVPSHSSEAVPYYVSFPLGFFSDLSHKL
jgi:hypothetical protein